MALPIEDRRHVDAAQGWLGLGDWNLANAELELVTARLRAHPFVLDVRWRIYALAGKWDIAVELAGVLMNALPKYRVTAKPHSEPLQPICGI